MQNNIRFSVFFIKINIDKNIYKIPYINREQHKVFSTFYKKINIDK